MFYKGYKHQKTPHFILTSKTISKASNNNEMKRVTSTTYLFHKSKKIDGKRR